MSYMLFESTPESRDIVVGDSMLFANGLYVRLELAEMHMIN
jgi:hypothetical protein